MANQQERNEGQVPVHAHGRAVVYRDPAEDWQVLGDTFEALGKAGLAITVGFSVAAAFCKMVDSGKIKLPNVLGMLVTAQEQEAEKAEKA